MRDSCFDLLLLTLMLQSSSSSTAECRLEPRTTWARLNNPLLKCCSSQNVQHMMGGRVCSDACCDTSATSVAGSIWDTCCDECRGKLGVPHETTRQDTTRHDKTRQDTTRHEHNTNTTLHDATILYYTILHKHYTIRYCPIWVYAMIDNTEYTSLDGHIRNSRGSRKPQGPHKAQVTDKGPPTARFYKRTPWQNHNTEFKGKKPQYRTQGDPGSHRNHTRLRWQGPSYYCSFLKDNFLKKPQYWTQGGPGSHRDHTRLRWQGPSYCSFLQDNSRRNHNTEPKGIQETTGTTQGSGDKVPPTARFSNTNSNILLPRLYTVRYDTIRYDTTICNIIILYNMLYNAILYCNMI